MKNIKKIILYFLITLFFLPIYSNINIVKFFKSEVPFAPDAYTVDHIVGGNEGSNPGVEANLGIQINNK